MAEALLQIITWLEEKGYILIPLLFSIAAGLLLTYGGKNLARPLRKLTLFLLGALIVINLIPLVDLLLQDELNQLAAAAAGAGGIGGLLLAWAEELLDSLIKVLTFIANAVFGFIAIIASALAMNISEWIPTDLYLWAFAGAALLAIYFAIIVFKIGNSAMVKAAEYAAVGSVFLLYPIANHSAFINQGEFIATFKQIWEVMTESDLDLLLQQPIWQAYGGYFLLLVASGMVVQLTVGSLHRRA